ncbi:aminotransferase class I/II-fold pyridoxal phosphate-dependent enzyme [Arcanobacterium haemolyticum]|nr:aminotransferase class I/II-fold pyridoxal phosphate-dependent enzyme [Arcanobacterium haemolyticum]
MAYNFDARTLDELADSGSVKWTRFPDTIDMWVAEMDFGISDEIRDFLVEEANTGFFGYLPEADSTGLVEAASTWFDRFAWHPDPSLMMPISEVLAGFRSTIAHFTKPGSAVVVPTPAYMPFLTIPAEFDREVIQVPSYRDENGVWRLDFEGIDRALEAGAGLVVLCNPWNPTGRCLSREELQSLDEVVSRHDAFVFEDAIHAPLIFDDATYVPYATISESAAAHSVTAVAASKGWNIPGLKCAQLIFHTQENWDRFQPYAHALTGATSTTGARAGLVAYTKSQDWNDEVRTYLQANRDYIEERVSRWNGVSMSHVEGTYITFLDFTELAKSGVFGNETPAVFLRRTAKVAFTEGTLSGADYSAYARVVFATTRAVIKEAFDRIEAALPALVTQYIG